MILWRTQMALVGSVQALFGRRLTFAAAEVFPEHKYKIVEMLQARCALLL
jgi:hypothetical protein